jgi:hypothetical protein
MESSFAEVKYFQVKPDRVDEFEGLIAQIQTEQKSQTGCVNVRYMKRFWVLDDLKPRELTRVVKCVRYFSFWEFDSREHYATAVPWFFAAYERPLNRLCIMPFDVNCGYIMG